MASYDFEFRKRVNEVAELENYQGAPFTLGRFCVRALRRTSPDLVKWHEEVHRRVITESIGKHGADPEDVFDALVQYSPGAILTEDRQKVREMIDTMGEELEDRYETQRAAEDNAYAKEKAARGGHIPFIQGPSEEEIARKVYGD